MIMMMILRYLPQGVLLLFVHHPTPPYLSLSAYYQNEWMDVFVQISLILPLSSSISLILSLSHTLSLILSLLFTSYIFLFLSNNQSYHVCVCQHAFVHAFMCVSVCLPVFLRALPPPLSLSLSHQYSLISKQMQQYTHQQQYCSTHIWLGLWIHDPVCLTFQLHVVMGRQVHACHPTMCGV